MVASQSWEGEGSKNSFGVTEGQLQVVSNTHTQPDNCPTRARVMMLVRCLRWQSHLAEPRTGVHYSKSDLSLMILEPLRETGSEDEGLMSNREGRVLRTILTKDRPWLGGKHGVT